METAVQEKFDYLESVLGQFIVTSNTSLSRLERNISVLSSEMKEFKDEMRDFKNEMREFKDEMLGFKNEMREFKDEMLGFKNEMLEFKDDVQDFKGEMKGFKDEMRDFKSMVEADIAESRADRKAMNKKWGELANKMGTVVEDIVAPCISGVAREYFQVAEFDFFAIRLQKKNGSGTMRREFDVVAESENHLFVVETKATPRTTDIQKFIDFVPEITDWFPAARAKTIVPVLASLYLPPDVVQFLTRNQIFALAMKDDNMDLLNPELLHQ
jgi:predicted  nucleic acid-binding Zn-ribbon protein